MNLNKINPFALIAQFYKKKYLLLNMQYALFYNTLTNEIDLYPKIENHTMTTQDIEKYLEQHPHSKKWTIFDHLPDENDIDNFESIIDNEEDDDDNNDDNFN